MPTSNWFKIETYKENHETYHYVGTSPETLETLCDKAQNGEFVRLENLLYMERGEYKDFESWDKSLIPAVMIHPRQILTIMQFKGDPRTIPNK